MRSLIRWAPCALLLTYACAAETSPPEATKLGSAFAAQAAEAQEQCYRFQAHDLAVADDETRFAAPAGEYYSCFFFDVPWSDGAQAVSFRSLETPLVHHWGLADTTADYTPGDVVRDAPNCGLGAERVFAIWGLGQQRELEMPPDVGLELPGPSAGRGLLLGVHYVNTAEATTDDAGVEVCVVERPRPHAASISLLGSEAFVLPPRRATTVSTHCTPSSDQEIHILRSFPHMHARGVRFEAVIERADGAEESLLAVDYDFGSQRLYDTPAVLHPGDRLRSECHYLNDEDRFIFSGDFADDEMCVNFVHAWPARALVAGSSVSGAADVCLE